MSHICGGEILKVLKVLKVLQYSILQVWFYKSLSLQVYNLQCGDQPTNQLTNNVKARDPVGSKKERGAMADNLTWRCDLLHIA